MQKFVKGFICKSLVPFGKEQQTWSRLQSRKVLEAAEIKVDKVSARQRAWQEAQLKYANYEHIYYSSYLECRLEPAKRLRHSHTAHTQIYPTIRQLRKLIRDDKGRVSGPQLPPNWMDDYEFYEGGMDEAGNIDSKHGTPDATLLPSCVPCTGCGAHLHCVSPSLPGYIPSEIFRGRKVTELKTITCQRCHFLKHYNIALDVEVTPDFYMDTISSIKDKYALALVLVDLLDFPCSIWPNLQQILGSKRPVFIVGNKVDLLPRNSNSYLQHITSCLRQQFVTHGGFDDMNIKHVGLISAKTGYGIEELITQLHKIWKHKGDVYLLGCTNVGKSTLFNILLNSDYCRPEATELVRKATTCPWPGTTLQMLKFPILRPSDIRVYQRFRRLFSERGQRTAEERLRRDQATKADLVQAAQLVGKVGRTFDTRTDLSDAFALSSGTQLITTLDERRKDYQLSKWCYDTPGVVQVEQITNLLTAEELLQLQPTQMISPRAYRLQLSGSLFLAGLGRLDFISAASVEPVDWVKVFVFSASNLPVLITSIEHADEVYSRYLGTELLGVPLEDISTTRLARWPGLRCKSDDIVVTGKVDANQRDKKEEIQLDCDITLSTAGWLGLALPANAVCTFRAWTPNAHGVFVRTPALVPLANRLVGKHIRNSLAYNVGKPFVFKK